MSNTLAYWGKVTVEEHINEYIYSTCTCIPIDRHVSVHVEDIYVGNVEVYVEVVMEQWVR